MNHEQPVPTESQAIARLKQGDLSGLETLVQQYQVKAVHAAVLIVHDRALAEWAATRGDVTHVPLPNSLGYDYRHTPNMRVLYPRGAMVADHTPTQSGGTGRSLATRSVTGRLTGSCRRLAGTCFASGSTRIHLKPRTWSSAGIAS